ncbi:MAG: tRNA threonylcarbamoyladenosine dehydratase [Bacilli bacterium]|nr:tRNA threonylcarbamoyladenosine dehydratase [Bacilli bacterium]
MEELSRLKLLIGREKVEQLKNKTVLILGLGGVGGYAVEALARSGVGRLILVDYDTIDITNMNRQIIASKSNIGKSKVKAWKERIDDISSIKTTIFEMRVTQENIASLFQESVDYAIDACDTVTVKIEFIKYCLKENIPFVTCLGTGKRLDASKIEITELMKTQNDPIAKVLRKKVREENIRQKVPVIYSKEVPKKIEGNIIGSSIFVPSCAGIMAANLAFKTLIEGE